METVTHLAAMKIGVTSNKIKKKHENFRILASFLFFEEKSQRQLLANI